MAASNKNSSNPCGQWLGETIIKSTILYLHITHIDFPIPEQKSINYILKI